MSATLAVAVPAGVGLALEAGADPVIVIAMGVVTGTFGGLIRDVVGNDTIAAYLGRLVERAVEHPMIDVTLFLDRRFSAACGAVTIA